MRVHKTTWQHIRRSPYQALAAILIMMLTLTVSGLFVLISIASSIILHHFEQKPQVTVFFTDAKKEADIQKLSDDLKKDSRVVGVTYISKEKALEIYKQEFQKDPLLLEMVSADILPASLEVSAQKIEYLKDLAANLRKEPDVEDVVYQQEVVDRLLAWLSIIRTVGVIVVAFLGLVSVFTIITVLSLKITLKRKEVEILQLVGASGWYIRGPFILEGGFYGFLGGLLGWVTNVGLLIYAAPFLSTLFTGVPLFPIPPWFYLLFLAGMAGGGVVLGVFASSLALLRYL